MLVDKKPVFTFPHKLPGEPAEGMPHVKRGWTEVQDLMISDDGKHWACLGQESFPSHPENMARWDKDNFNQENMYLAWSVVLDGKGVTPPGKYPGRLELSKGGVGFSYKIGTANFWGTKDLVKMGSPDRTEVHRTWKL